MPAVVYRLRDWNRHFEHHAMRKLERPKWVSIPNNHDGLRIQRVLHHENGLAIFGAWCLIVQALSRQGRPRHGWLTDDGTPRGQPWTATDLAFRWRRRDAEIEEALAVLSGAGIGWIERIPVDQLETYLIEHEDDDDGEENGRSDDENGGNDGGGGRSDRKNGRSGEKSGGSQDSGTGEQTADSDRKTADSDQKTADDAGNGSKSAAVARARESSRVESSRGGSGPVGSGPGPDGRHGSGSTDAQRAPPVPPGWSQGNWEARRRVLGEHGAERLDRERERWEQIVNDHPETVLQAIADAQAAGRRRTARAIGKTLDDQAAEIAEARRAELGRQQAEERQQRMAQERDREEQHRHDLERARDEGPALLGQAEQLIAQGCEPPGGGGFSVGRWLDRMREGSFCHIGNLRVREWLSTDPQPAIRSAEPEARDAPEPPAGQPASQRDAERPGEHQDAPDRTTSHQEPPPGASAPPPPIEADEESIL